MLDWLHHMLSPEQLYRLGVFLTLLSFFTFVLSLLLIPWIVGKLPADCLLKLVDRPRSASYSPLRLLLSLIRNIFGLLLLLAGIAMLFLPGQGLLTILISLLFLSFPGKRQLLMRILALENVRKSLNWLRRKRSVPPLRWPEQD